MPYIFDDEDNAPMLDEKYEHERYTSVIHEPIPFTDPLMPGEAEANEEVLHGILP